MNIKDNFFYLIENRSEVNGDNLSMPLGGNVPLKRNFTKDISSNLASGSCDSLMQNKYRFEMNPNAVQPFRSSLPNLASLKRQRAKVPKMDKFAKENQKALLDNERLFNKTIKKIDEELHNIGKQHSKSQKSESVEIDYKEIFVAHLLQVNQELLPICLNDVLENLKEFEEKMKQKNNN